MYKTFKFIVTVILILTSITTAKAQITTSEMSGKITDEGNVPIIGATVVAVHEPSGTSYGSISNVNGMFTIQGMRTGGPYKVTISYIGYQTAIYKDIALSLGNTYQLNVTLHESSELLDEVVVTGMSTKFNTERTGATTNLSSEQIRLLPTIDRNIYDLAKLSPYSSGTGFAGSDPRLTNFTVDGANFNNNFGLSDDLPGGGNPISMDAIEEIQFVVAPYDVRQSNFIGGGINAVTKSGTNTFKGSAYTYQFTQDMRGSKVDGEYVGYYSEEAKRVYGATLGGPIIKNKLFFFANVEFEQIPEEVTKWRACNDAEGEEPSSGDYISEAKMSDMQLVKDHLMSKYGYDTGSYTEFPKDRTNLKLLGRIDWNINNNNRLSVRYNYTLNKRWYNPNANSADTGYRLYNTYRVGENSMSFYNSFYSQDNKVSSISADLNSRITEKMNNQLLFTYTAIKDMRGSASEPFPFIDIMQGKDAEGNQIFKPYISAGYELFSWNNGVNNKVYTLTDNFTYYAGEHKITAGFTYEHQFANNAYMRNGTGYYRYNSLEDFLTGAAPETFALTYGYNGVDTPNGQVTFDQVGFYAQDEWNVSKKFKLTYGIRFDELIFNDKDVKTNKAILAYDFGGKSIDTGKWPASRMQYSPRIGFVWDVFGDKSLKVRGGTGLFAGRLPLVFFTNMPQNSGMIQNSVSIQTDYKNGATPDARLNLLKGGLLTNVDDMIRVLGLPTTISDDQHVAPSSIVGIDEHFKMPQVWKSSIAADYQIPVSFPFTVTGEFMYTKNISSVMMVNYNIKPSDNWERFSGADNRLIYPNDYEYYSNISDACVLTNTSKGWGYTANITLNAQPVKDLNLMAAYTHTEYKEVSGMPGSSASSAWQSLCTVDGPNYSTVQRSEYVLPDKVIASVSYYVPFKRKRVTNGLHLSLMYRGYSPYGNSYCYTNDMNGDGISNDLMYIPKDDSEIVFANEADRKDFWAFVEQDKYLRKHKGEYAEAYAARNPWVHRFDFRYAQDFKIKAGKTTNTIQVSLDILNIGNLFNSAWGVSTTNRLSNSARILKYEGTVSETDKTPVFSLYRDSDGNAPTETYSFNKSYTECWQFQIGIKYMFN